MSENQSDAFLFKIIIQLLVSKILFHQMQDINFKAKEIEKFTNIQLK